MQCKICENGLILKTLAHRNSKEEVIIALEPAACDCCGGFFEDCENCEAGKRVAIVG